VKAVARRCVVDTNVGTTANGRNPGAGVPCATASGVALHEVMLKGHVFIDSGGQILKEYRSNLLSKGQPGPGTVFLKWILTNEWVPARVTHVDLTPKDSDPEDFKELPAATGGVSYDRSDRVFLAVAAAHPEHPLILQSFDSKWWGWQESLAKCGVTIHFLCPDEIAAKHKKKMGC
jgi:hypothetical protein